MTKKTEKQILENLESLAVDCAEYAQGKITAERMAFYCKNIADNCKNLRLSLNSKNKQGE